MEVGTQYLGGGRCRFAVWALFPRDLELVIVGQECRAIPSKKDDWGYWRFDVENAFPGTRYFYRLEGSKERPDPASRFQPEGVNGPSQVIDHEYPWSDTGWEGIPRIAARLVKEVVYPLGRSVWGDDRIVLSGAPRTWKDAITGQPLEAEGTLYLRDALMHFPASLLLGKEER